MTQFHDLTLAGCTPDPMAGYLKALGVLRLVAQQRQAESRGYWHPQGFGLLSALDEEGLIRFFLDEYVPTPVLAPWNGGGGFWDRQAAGQALDRLARSTNPRLAAYREAVERARAVIAGLGLRNKPQKAQKARLLQAFRSRMPDTALPWLDAAVVLAAGEPGFAPILGSGGNDGRLDFTANFIQHLERVLPFGTEASGPNRPRRGSSSRYDPGQSRAWLEDALFARSRPPLVNATGGQYHPGSVGGPNATRGMEGNSLLNPWDYVLMIEGALLFAGAAARRLGRTGRARSSFPFTVDPSPVGSGTAAEGEVASSRGEIWLPLWHQPATFPAIQQLMAEGRAQVGRRQARTGVDFARAVASLGVDRGVAAFQRYGLLSRNGRAYLATPLDRLEVRARPHVHLVQQLDPWLEEWRRFTRSGHTPARFLRTLRAMEAAIYHYCATGHPSALQKVLVAAGRAEQALATAPRLERKPRPLSDLSLDWVGACDDQSLEYQLAVSIASIWDKILGPLRLQLEPVTVQGYRYQWAPDEPAVVWGESSLADNLVAVLERRILAARRAGGTAIPNAGAVPAPYPAIHAFLQGQLDEERVADLVWGLATLRWLPGSQRPRVDDCPTIPPDLSRSYALLKLTFWPGPLQLHAAEQPTRITPDLSILNRLRAGDLPGALTTAGRKLWARNLAPLGYGQGARGPLSGYAAPPGGCLRLAAALLIPVANPWALARLVLRAQTIRKGVDAG